MKESGRVDWLWDEIANYLSQHNGYLQGRLLTQLEASMPPGRQLEALKEIVKSILWQENEDRHGILFGLFKEYAQDSGVSTVAFSITPGKPA